MSTVSEQSAGAVRSAAEAVKAAIAAHLAAVEARGGEDDPGVQAAYDRLRAAAEAYDDLLFDTYDEVTPFEFAEEPQGPTAEGPVEGSAEDAAEDAAEAAEGPDEAPERLTMLLRRDYDVVNVDQLLGAGREARAQVDGDEAEGGEDTGDDEHLGSAVFHVVHAYGVDGLHARAEDIGLEPTGATMWLLDEVGGDIEADPFDGVDEDRVLLRLDEIYALDEQDQD